MTDLSTCYDAIISAPASMSHHVEKVLAGEYDVKGYSGTPGVVLDIGANVGAFAVWAHRRWPQTQIYCYEPGESNFSLLCRNVDFAVLERVAVTAGSGETKLHHGRNNCGECSIYCGDEQTLDYEMVKTVGADSLPSADFVKIDTEGCELEILTAYLADHKPAAISLEWHSTTDRGALGTLLLSRGYTIQDIPWRTDRGNMKAWLE